MQPQAYVRCSGKFEGLVFRWDIQANRGAFVLDGNQDIGDAKDEALRHGSVPQFHLS